MAEFSYPSTSTRMTSEFQEFYYATIKASIKVILNLIYELDICGWEGKGGAAFLQEKALLFILQHEHDLIRHRMLYSRHSCTDKV